MNKMQTQTQSTNNLKDTIEREVTETAHDEWLRSLNNATHICGPMQNQKTDSGLIQKQYALPYDFIDEIIRQENITKEWFQERYDHFKATKPYSDLMLLLVGISDEGSISDDIFKDWMQRLKDNVPTLNASSFRVSEVLLQEFEISGELGEDVGIKDKLTKLMNLYDQCAFINQVEDSNIEIDFILKHDTLRKMMIAAHHYWRVSSFGITEVPDFKVDLKITKDMVDKQFELHEKNYKNITNDTSHGSQQIINTFAEDRNLSSFDSFVRMLALGSHRKQEEGIINAIALDANIKVVEVILNEYIKLLYKQNRMRPEYYTLLSNSVDFIAKAEDI